VDYHFSVSIMEKMDYLKCTLKWKIFDLFFNLLFLLQLIPENA